MSLITNAKKLQKLPSLIYKLGTQAYIDWLYPRHLFIELTTACQLSCSYCARPKKSEYSAHMDWNVFKEIVDEATTYGRRSFSLHLFGEPTLYPKFIEAVQYLKKHRHHVILTTNGIDLAFYIDKLIALGVDQILWTYRPEPRFSWQLKKKLKNWGRFRVRFIDGETPIQGMLQWSSWKNKEIRRKHNYGGFLGGNGKHFQNRWPCYHLYLAPAVAANGDILICCCDPKHLTWLGTFPNRSIANAWQGLEIGLLRKQHQSGDYRGVCSSCDVWQEFKDFLFKWQKI